MQLMIAALGFAVALHAGTVRGVVVEHASGRALARSLVRLDPLPGSAPGVKPVAIRAGRVGQFLFPSVAAGSYLLTAVRDGYFPAGFGQRLPAGRGRPIEVTGDSSLFAELRLRHKGVITGRVLDENGVVVAKHFRKAPPEASVGLLRSARELRFGDTALTLYRWVEPDESQEDG